MLPKVELVLHDIFQRLYYLPIPEHAINGKNHDCPSRHSFFPGGIFLISVSAQLQHE